MATTTRTNGGDSPGSPTRLPVLGPLHTPGSLAPLEYLQLTQRRGSISDHLLQASSTSLPDNPRSTRQSFSFPPKMSSDHHHWQSQPQSESPVDDPRTPTSVPPSSTFLPPPSAYSSSGTKRKMSHDRHTFAYPDDPPYQQGYSQQQDSDGPIPKRRGSTFETGNRIAHLSLQDRRDSIDSRSSISAASIGGWGADRRDSAASMYSTTSIGSSVSGGYSTASANDQQQPQKPYPWSSQQPSSQPQDSPPQDPSAPSRTYSFPDQQSTPPQQQPSNTHSYTVPPAPIPSIHYAASAAAARRLSIPDLPLNGIKPRRRASRSAAAVASESNNTEEPERSITPGGDINMNPAVSPTGGQGPASGDSSGNSLASPQFVNSHHSPPTAPVKETPYSRSPELRVSHKLAERKRRKEMKELFDELRDQLPADRGMKASKWEILSKAVDYISQLKVAYTDMSTEIERLRRELDTRPSSMAPHQHQVPPLATYISPTQQQPPPNPLSQNGTPANSSQPLPPVLPPHSPMDASPSIPNQHRPESGGGLSARHSPFATPTPQQSTQPLPAQGS
ncbi:hypothetical protein FRC02_012031 [Tulasnella sp. 418]|nr:hypothetical protein FRC02_012031 [Tulasnella sp. 418]